jgi:mannose-6-phosphate isomerase-like protein (cupin superfamily)
MTGMHAQTLAAAELEEAWIDGDDGARWRSVSASGSGTGAAASGSSILEVDGGFRLPPHKDDAEETIVVLSGHAEVVIDGEPVELSQGIAVVPANVTHEVRNAGEDALRFVAVYAAPDVTTTYGQEVQPDGGTERKSTA